jgi:DNA-binding transcriptional ArsR family regulator
MLRNSFIAIVGHFQSIGSLVPTRLVACDASAGAEAFGLAFRMAGSMLASMANMASGNTIATVAALLGEPARANIMSALMSGQALTAGELARSSGVTAQTTSGHLARLAEAELIVPERQGRHRYYRLASVEVAQMVETLSIVASMGPKRHHPVGPRDAALRKARTCYDHLAGRLGLAIADSMQAKGLILLADGAGLLTPAGQGFAADFGLDLHDGSKRPLCRTCLDWSERRHHLAGRLGAAILARLLERHWVKRSQDSRALIVTRSGEHGLAESFGLAHDWSME